MRRYALVLAAVLTLWIVGDHAILAQNPPDNCGPRYRRDPVATNRARETKKAEMRQRGFPERFLHLLDREECVACVEMASDAFHIKVVYNDDANAPVSSKGFRWTAHTFQWDPQSERWAREQLAAGKIKAFYIMNTATRCQCCPDVNDDTKTNASYDDWDEELDLHRSHVIPYEKPGDLGPLPPDLENPPPGWTEDVPNVQQFFKPPRRYVHVICQACQPIADRWNDAAGTLDYLWDRKLSLQEGISITENAMANRRNQIARLEYQQLFASTATPERQRQIDELKRVNEGQQASVEYEERRLAEVDRSIAEQTARMAAIMKELLACEEKCKTTTATTATTTGTTPPVTAKPATETTTPPQVTEQIPAAVCPQCRDAASEVARLQRLIDQARASLPAVRDAIGANQSQIDNLVRLREEAVRRGNAAQAGEFDGRITQLRANVAELQQQVFAIEQQIRQLSEALSEAVRALEACLQTCGQSMAAMPEYRTLTGGQTGSGQSPAKPTLVITPIAPRAACKECEALVALLEREFQRLQDLAKRANDRQMDSDYEDFEAQRVRVADIQGQLDACNRKCTTTTATNTAADIGTTGGTGTIPVPANVCPECRAAAAEVARLQGLIEQRQRDVKASEDAQAANQTQIDNLGQLREGATRRGNATLAAEFGQRTTQLQAANAELRTQAFAAQQEIARLNDALADAVRALEACLQKCGQTMAAMPEYRTLVPGVDGPRTARPTLSVSPVSATAACQKCEALAAQLQREFQRLQDLAKRANDRQMDSDYEDFEEQRVRVEDLRQQLAACNRTCTTPTATDTTATTVGTTPPASPPVTTTTPPVTTNSPATTTGCMGDACADSWRGCSESNTCTPVERDCGIPGTCDPRPCSLGGGGDCLDLTNQTNWPCDGCDADPTVQVKQVDIIITQRYPQYLQGPNDLWIPPMPRQGAEQWFNPLGLIARTLTQAMERWRGSMGPTPLIRPADLTALEPYSGGQSAGLPAGVHMLLMDSGGSTGQTLALQILNLSGKPVRLKSLPFAVEPIRQQAQQRVQQAFNRLAKAAPVKLDLSAYCLEFLKAPPRPNTLLRLAPQPVQQKYASMTKVLQSAYRVQQAGLLRPDSNPAAYTDSIKQWAVWAVEQRLNERSFTEAFIGHTKKNVEAAGQQFPRQAEDTLRKVSPNRWQDIMKILRGAGVSLPQ